MRVITTTKDLDAVCTRLAAADFVAVDTEFMREQTYWPDLCLVQLAGPEDEAIVDPRAPGMDLAPFFALMTNRNVVKVFHAARQDIEIIFAAAGQVPAPLFDTQVAAMVCGFGESIGYMSLVKEITGHTLDKSSRFTDWSRRPLSQKQLAYALGDVTYLRHIYRHLAGELRATSRTSWLSEEMAALTDPAVYDLNPETAWRRLRLKVKNRRSLGVLMELAAWREKLAQTQNVPRGRILRDDILAEIVNRAPTAPEQLSELRMLGEGFWRSARAREIVEAVQRGLEREVASAPLPVRTGPLPPEAAATAELLRVLLKAQAARHRVAPRLIADAEDLDRIAAEPEPDVPALTGWRRQVFGEEALRLKRGEIALAVRNGTVTIIPVPASVPGKGVAAGPGGDPSARRAPVCP